MKPFRHPKDPAEFAFPRTVRRPGKRWKLAAVAKAAPHELDKVAESPVHDQLEAEIQETGYPYLSFREAHYGWLKRHADRGTWQAIELLETLKDFPDLCVFAPAPGMPYCLALPLELKRGKGGHATPGQERFSETVGGTIAAGYTQAHAALDRFLKALPGRAAPAKPSPFHPHPPETPNP